MSHKGKPPEGGLLNQAMHVKFSAPAAKKADRVVYLLPLPTFSSILRIKRLGKVTLIFLVYPDND